MPLKYFLAAAIVLLTLSGCTTTSAENNTYASPQGIGPVRGSGINGY
jgi:outer membrane lipoprotein SlyB